MSCVSLTYKEDKDQHGLKLLLSELSKYPVGGLGTTESRKVNLDLSGISEQGAEHIASYLKQCSAIISALRMTECDGDGVLHIVKSLQINSSLTEIHLLSYFPNDIEQTSSALTKMLQINRSIKSLDISENSKYLSELEVGSAELLFRSIIAGLQHNTTLLNLSLQYNGIKATDPDTASFLVKLFRVNKTLRHLNISYNSLSDLGARCIFECLQHNTTLVNLLLCQNAITAIDPDTASSLTKMLQVNKSLTHLDLSRNSLRDSGARCIFEGLQYNTTLVSFSLQRNNITATVPDTATSLTTMLQVNKSLTHLDLSYNQFQNHLILCIFQELKHNTTLLHLYLRNTGITDDDAEYIGHGLESNISLLTLDITQNSCLKDEGTRFIFKSLLFNTTLKELQVNSINSETEEAFHKARRDKGLPPLFRSCVIEWDEFV